jgi:hypothetical protein
VLPEGWLTEEPPRPALVDELRVRLAEGDAAWRSALRASEEAAVEWRWAHPYASVVPLRVEILWGKRTRWLDRRPPASWGACEVGLDAEGRLVLVREPGAVDESGRPVGNALTVIRHDGGLIDIWEVHPSRGLQSVGRWLLGEHGRIVDGAEAGPERSWRTARFAYDGERVVGIEEVWWIDEERAQRGGGWSRADVTYDGDGSLDGIVRFRSVDGATLVDFRAKPLTGRRLADELDRLLREALDAALADLREPHEIRAIGLVYDSLDAAPPTLVVDRSDRLRDLAELSLDDVSPLEWGAAEQDVVDLAAYGIWPALDEDTGPRPLHRRIRALVKGTDPARVQALLGTPRPPRLLAMDTEREHAEANLADAFGRGAARRIMRRAD